MGLISGLMNFLFGDGRNVVVETAEVFRENAENRAVRQADAHAQSLQQFAAEFAYPRRGLFDRVIDGLNRLPRPFLALGTIWLFVAAILWPADFRRGMEGLALVPDPLWWLMTAIVSFYFGARHQAKGQEFQRAIASAMAAQRQVQTPSPKSDNAALQDWYETNG
ncbi:holin family protein [Loktanella sp. S4079]|uniref:holin family protein n=1 Tax=Loktanella sp. S4079 TaxID=579483 RepID=UPI0005FA8487|nr:holin family protein [Loktanella sp. S4079]KJZ19963.1 hypothetical protein TW80_03640 [Loktanella sp. S4079]